MGTGVLGLGAGILAVAMAVLVVVLHAAGTHPHAYAVGPVLFVAGLGLGLFVAPLTNLVLAGIQGREAGSASGTLSTVQQIGGALGVALIGLVLFTLLGGHAATAVTTQTPSITRALTAAGLPAGTVTRVVSGRGGLQDCFVRRSKSPDPSTPPPGCAPQKGGPAAIGAALEAAGRQAQKDNFRYAIERTLAFEVLVFAAAFLLVRRLPAVRPGTLGQSQTAEA